MNLENKYFKKFEYSKELYKNPQLKKGAVPSIFSYENTPEEPASPKRPKEHKTNEIREVLRVLHQSSVNSNEDGKSIGDTQKDAENHKSITSVTNEDNVSYKNQIKMI